MSNKPDIKPIFTAEDFEINDRIIVLKYGKHETYFADLNVVNEKLAKIIESWPVVYGRWEGVHRNFGESAADKANVLNHKVARLAFIEEIVKEDCVHEAKFKVAVTDKGMWKQEVVGINCKHCGVELVATWSAKNGEV